MPTKHDKQGDSNNELAEAIARRDEYLAGWKRALADYQNLVKETAKNQAEFAKYANVNLVLAILPVLDNFKIALSQITEVEKGSALVTGFSHIKKQLEDILKECGCEAIKAVGEQFNPSEHEAVETVVDENCADNVIVMEKKSGYKLNGRVVQVAKVVVNTKDAKSRETNVKPV